MLIKLFKISNYTGKEPTRTKFGWVKQLKNQMQNLPCPLFDTTKPN